MALLLSHSVHVVLYSGEFLTKTTAAPSQEPAVSVGNVGQLAVDMVISTLWMERIGYIYHDSILPLVGNDPFAHPESVSCKIVTSCEVYENIESKTIIIQQRSPFIRGKRTSFKQWLKTWMKEEKIEQLVILTSSHAHERIDCQLEGSQFRFIAGPTIEAHEIKELKSNLEWQELEKRLGEDEMRSGNDSSSIYIPGAGIAKSLFQECSNEMKVCILLMFCAEGDNAGDALELAKHMNDWLNIIDMEPKRIIGIDGKPVLMPGLSWKVPHSWKLMYGSNVDRTLFH